MDNDLDLSELAIDRGDAHQISTRRRRHLATRYGLPSLLLVGLASLLLWASRDLIFPPKPVRVVPVYSTTAEVQLRGAELFMAAGWIEPRPTPIRVAALAPGVVDRLLVVEDQAVVAGEPIAELVKDDAKLAYEGALAAYALTEAELEEAGAFLTAAKTRLSQPVHLQASLGEANASLARIETLLNNLPYETRRAVSDYESLRRDYEGKLEAQGVVKGVDIDMARSKADAAEALVEELQDRIESLRKEQDALVDRRDALRTELELLASERQAKDEAEARVQAGRARLEQARVAVAEAKLALDRMTVVAPVDGRVFRLVAHPGARIGSGMTHMLGHDGSTVVTMYRPKLLQVRVDVRFEDIPKVRLKQPVQIDNPALDSPLTGAVLFISSEADIQKNTLQVKVAIPDPPAVFKPEMLVDVTFLASAQSSGGAEASQQMRLFIPQQLVHEDDGRTFVWIADQSEGVARSRVIETGAPGANGLLEVTDGLQLDSRLISTGDEGLTDGDRISIIGEDPMLGTQNKTSS